MDSNSASDSEIDFLHPVQSEILCFIGNKTSVLTTESLVDLCASFYKLDEIESARTLLAKYLPNRLPKHRGSDAEKKVKTVTDIVKTCLDSNVNLPTFYAVDLTRLPPVGVEHIDLSALLKEVVALRSEVRAATAIKEELAAVRAEFATMVSTMTTTNDLKSTGIAGDLPTGLTSTILPISINEAETATKSMAQVLSSAIQSGSLNVSKPANKVQRVSQQAASRQAANGSNVKKPRKVIVGTASNSHLKPSVDTVRQIDIFVSRLHPGTVQSELVECITDAKGDTKVLDINCTLLKSKYEYLYSSYHIEIKVTSDNFKKAIELFTSPDTWPSGILVRRYFKPKNVSGSN